MTITTATSEVRPRAARPRRIRLAEGRSTGRVAVPDHAARTVPPLLTAFRTRDGKIRHAHCGSPLVFQGRRAELELDFYCPRCVEHVTLPECILSRIPLGAGGSGD